jgi:hypothetical protein
MNLQTTQPPLLMNILKIPNTKHQPHIKVKTLPMYHTPTPKFETTHTHLSVNITHNLNPIV